ncbi:MAG: DUF1905 domain-containing protein [Vicingaceae bacterium]|nr:DUF1905 domain-containing protein [Vicingaceae bacterium]
MIVKAQYRFAAKVWKHSAAASWYFVSLPIKQAKEIRFHFQNLEEGWGRLSCNAQIGKTRWNSAIWFDTKHQSYILPLKAEIRKKEQITTAQQISITVFI